MSQSIVAESRESNQAGKDNFQLKIDGLTVKKITKRNTRPPTYDYIILETNKIFSSSHSDLRSAYLGEKRKFARIETVPIKPPWK